MCVVVHVCVLEVLYMEQYGAHKDLVASYCRSQLDVYA